MYSQTCEITKLLISIYLSEMKHEMMQNCQTYNLVFILKFVIINLTESKISSG